MGTTLRRRSVLLALGASASPGLVFSQGNSPKGSIKPTWLGFGLNVPSNIALQRFPLTTSILPSTRQGRNRPFQLEINQAIVQQIKSAGDFVTFSDVNNIGESSMLGAVLDYENVLEARLGDTSFIVLHLVGHGVLLDFSSARGWSMRSSFPFPVTLLRENQAGNAQSQARQYLAEAFLDNQNSFATSFAKTAKRIAPTWKELGAGSGFNVRVMSSSIHPDAQAKLKGWGIDKNVTATWLGHLVSAAVCEGLDIPVVPFAETQSLGNYTYTFSDRLVAQNVRLPEESDIDLRIHVVLRNVAREIKYRSQLQRWEATRIVVLDIKIKDDRDEEIVVLRMGYQDEQPDALAREEDNSPARDAHFFDMGIYRGLQTLFSGIDKDDRSILAKVSVKPDGKLQSGLELFRSKYRKAFGKGA